MCKANPNAHTVQGAIRGMRRQRRPQLLQATVQACLQLLLAVQKVSRARPDQHMHPRSAEGTAHGGNEACGQEDRG